MSNATNSFLFQHKLSDGEIHDMSNATPASRETARKTIAEQVKQYLAKGGKITYIRVGIAFGDDLNPFNSTGFEAPAYMF